MYFLAINQALQQVTLPSFGMMCSKRQLTYFLLPFRSQGVHSFLGFDNLFATYISIYTYISVYIYIYISIYIYIYIYIYVCVCVCVCVCVFCTRTGEKHIGQSSGL